MSPQMQPQSLAVPPDDGFRRLVGVATPDPEPDFTITSYGKNHELNVVLGFRRVSEMDGLREITGGVAIELHNNKNPRTGEVLIGIGRILQAAGLEISGDPSPFISLPNPGLTVLFLEPNARFPDSASVIARCQKLFNEISQLQDPPVSIPIRPDIHQTPESKELAPGARYDLSSGKVTHPEDRRDAGEPVLSLPVVGKMVDGIKSNSEFEGAGWGTRVWGQVQVSAYRQLKNVASREKSAAVSLGAFLDELDNISSIPKMTLPQRNLLMVAYSELANQVERVGLA